MVASESAWSEVDIYEAAFDYVERNPRKQQRFVGFERLVEVSIELLQVTASS